MVTIKNNQKKIYINKPKLKKLVQKILKIIEYENFDLGVWFTTDATIKKYNDKYRNKNKVTDILSFPYYKNKDPDEKIIPLMEDDKNLGDIIISLECAQSDAATYNRSLEEHIKVLLVHGVCHLIGYDHTKKTNYEKMNAQELEILKKLN